MRIAYFLFGQSPSSTVRAKDFAQDLKSFGVHALWIQAYPVGLLRIANGPAPQIFARVIRKVCNLSLRFTLFFQLIRLLILSPRIDGIVVIKFCPVWALKIMRLSRRPILYDFDDAVWLEEFLGKETFEGIIRRVDFVSTDNNYLAAYARRLHPRVFLMPGSTSLDLFVTAIERKTAVTQRRKIVGWIGSPSTAPYLDIVAPALNSLFQEGLDFQLNLIGCPLPFAEKLFPGIPKHCLASYDQQTMIDEVIQFDLGLFPINQDPKSLGRGAHKVRIYMSAKVACLASAVGEVTTLIEDMKTGIHVVERDWKGAIHRVLMDDALRRSIAANGHQFALTHFRSNQYVQILKEKFLNQIDQ